MSNRTGAAHTDPQTGVQVLHGGDNGLASIRCPKCKSIASPTSGGKGMLKCGACQTMFMKTAKAWLAIYNIGRPNLGLGKNNLSRSSFLLLPKE